MKIAFVHDEVPNDEILSHSVYAEHLLEFGIEENICRGFTPNPLLEAKTQGLLAYISDPYELCREIAEFCPDFVYIEGVSADTLAVILGAGFNCCIRLNGDESIFRGYALNSLVTDFMSIRKLKRAIKEAAGIIGLIFASKRVQQEFIRVFNIENVPGAVIPRPVDITDFANMNRAENIRKNCLILERFERGKAGQACVDAIFSLRFVPEFAASRIVFAGSGKRFLDETRMLRPYHNVSVLNRSPDERGAYKLIATNGVLLHPVKTLAQSLMLTCAMASGMAVVTLDGGMSELIEHGKTGYIASSPIEMGACIESMWDDPLNFMLVSKQAKEIVREKCSVQAVCSEENKFLKWIVRER